MIRTAVSALGLLALIVAIVVGALATLGILSDAPTGSLVGSSEAKGEAPKSEQMTRRINRPVTAGDLAWTVGKVRRTGELHAYTLPPTALESDFLILTFTVENTSDGPITLTEDSMTLLDEETGIKDLPAASVNTEYVIPRKSILFNERSLLDPGEKAEGKVVFDLAVPYGEDPTADLSGFRVELDDADPTAEEERQVDLGV